MINPQKKKKITLGSVFAFNKLEVILLSLVYYKSNQFPFKFSSKYLNIPAEITRMSINKMLPEYYFFVTFEVFVRCEVDTNQYSKY